MLNFKREFSMEDGIRMFEVLSSQYLELSSDEAVRAKHKAVAVEFLAKGTYLPTYVKYIRDACPFHLAHPKECSSRG